MSAANFYGAAKAALSEGITVHGWWTKPYDLHQLVRAFGVDALQRGIDGAGARGYDPAPENVQRELDEFKDSNPEKGGEAS